MNSNPKTLCIFTPAFPKDEVDTIWVPWLQLFVRAANKEFPLVNIVIFSFQYPHSINSYKWKENVVYPFNGMHKKKFPRLIMWINILQKFRTVKKKNNVIGIFSMWCNETTFLAKLCSTLFGVKYHCWILGGDARKGNNYVRLIRPKPDNLIAMSDFLAGEFYKNYAIQPKYVIPNGIDTSLFKHFQTNRDIDVVGAGAFHAMKHYDLFVEVIAELKKTFPCIKALLCGDGEKRSDIENMINNLSLQENIEIAGMIPHLDVLKMMQRAKVFLHPSSYEGFSSVCLEALYAGTHVISFVKPMKHDIKNWHVVNTKQEMIAKTLELLKNPNTKFESLLVYSIDEVAKKVMQLFDVLS